METTKDNTAMTARIGELGQLRPLCLRSKVSESDNVGYVKHVTIFEEPWLEKLIYESR